MKMMNKIFLLLILIMSGLTPVFAVEGSLQTSPNDTIIVGGCSQDPLTGVQVSANAASFTAQWTANQLALTWDTNGGVFTNMISAHPAHTWESNGITVTTKGDGVYVLNGTATAAVTITVPVDEFTIPVSKGQGGTGAVAFNNNQASTDITLRFYYNNTQSDSWMLSPANRFNNSYSAMANKQVNQIRFSISSGKILENFTVAPAIYNDSRTSAGTFGVGAPAGNTAGNTCTYDNAITLPSEPTKTGFSFMGWKLDND